jgi:hypothetical protein
VSFGGGLAFFRHFSDRVRSKFFDLDSDLVFLALILALLLIDLFLVLSATTAVTFPAFAFSRAFTSALLLFEMESMTLIGRGWVGCKSDVKGLSNLRRLSTTNSVSRDPIPYLKSELLEES